MKKLMIAAAIVCAAALSQAASVNWMANTGVEETYMDYTAYCFFSNVAGSEKYSATTVAALMDAINAKTLTSDFTLQLDDFGDGMSAFADDTAWGMDSTVNGFAILVNSDDISTATQYMVMDSKAAVTFADPADSQSISLAVGTWKDIGGTPPPPPIPEPTSGLLMLLGVAGLALRRKQK